MLLEQNNRSFHFSEKIFSFIILLYLRANYYILIVKLKNTIYILYILYQKYNLGYFWVDYLYY